MQRIDTLIPPGRPAARVELLLGDLTALDAEYALDVLVVSAFPGDYLPTPGSLIGALHRKGLSVEALAADKDVDLRSAYACWLSRPLAPTDPGLRFSRILCFEPATRGQPPEVVGDIFRALTPILAERPEIRRIGLPVVAAGDQGYAIPTMLAPLLEAAVHWITHGLPIERLSIVLYDAADVAAARETFERFKAQLTTPVPQDLSRRLSPEADAATPEPATVAPDYDVFISYSHKNTAASEALEAALRRLQPDLRIFVDRKDLDIGCAWQPEIFETLDRCRKVVALLSPDYLASKVCKEEFNIAWIRAREADQDIIFPLYLFSAALPTYMKYRNFIDCREGDADKIEAASKVLLKALASGPTA